MTAIVIITFNIKIEVFLLQVEAIRKFCKDNVFTIKIFDNSTNAAMAEGVRYHSERLGVDYVKTLAGDADSSRSHAFAANYAVATLSRITGPHNYFLFLDHDCLPVKPFSVKEILGDKLLAGLAQNKSTTYFWPGCFMWDAIKVDPYFINFSPSAEKQLDTGGLLHLAIEKYGRHNCIFFDEIICGNPGYTGAEYNFYTMLCNSTFMHFINASNWNRLADNPTRLNSLINIAKEKMGI